MPPPIMATDGLFVVLVAEESGLELDDAAAAPYRVLVLAARVRTEDDGMPNGFVGGSLFIDGRKARAMVVIQQHNTKIR